MISKKYLFFSSLLLLSITISACSSAIYSSTGWHGLAASADTAYLAAGTQIYAIDLNTGSEDWRYPAKPNAKISFYANPVLSSDGQLIIPGYDHSLYSLNPATGFENWIFTGSTNRLIGSPLVTQDMIYQPSTDHYIYAVDLEGKQVWKSETGGPRSEEHTSELQSHLNLVCRLLLEKKKKRKKKTCPSHAHSTA